MLPEKKYSLLDRVLNLLFYSSALLIVFLVVCVCYTVFMRYFMKSPPLWTVQATEYALLWIVFLATSYVLREKGHISIDIVYSRFTGRKKKVSDILIYAICSFFMSLVTIFSLAYLFECISSGVTDVRTYTVPKSIVFSVVPLGSFFLTLQFFRMLLKELKDLWNGI